MSDEQIQDLILSRVPGTSCRKIYMEYCEGEDSPMTFDTFRELFNQTVSEVGSGGETVPDDIVD